MMYRELLLGCGYRRKRLVDPYPHYQIESHRLYGATLVSEESRWQNLVTVDLNPACNPDLVMDLSDTVWNTDPAGVKRAQPEVLEDTADGNIQFKADSFHEVHAYEVLEHLGWQGNYEAYFAHFAEIWRVLVPGGFLCATVPSRHSIWAWGDPGHTRIISIATIGFLVRPNYEEWVGKGPSSDYRSVFDGDFDIVYSRDDDETHTFVLQAVKPQRKTAAEYSR